MRRKGKWEDTKEGRNREDTKKGKTREVTQEGNGWRSKK